MESSKKTKKPLLKEAFTLVELLVVMVIIGILIGLAVFGLSAAQKSARDTNRRNDVRNIVNALETYAIKNGGAYPGAATLGGSGDSRTFDITTGAGETAVESVQLKSVKPSLDTDLTKCVTATNGTSASDSRSTFIGLQFNRDGFKICVSLETDNKGLSETRGADN
jgi:prepilin-type N-terminal cleavage/methylation domain-containing protein